jgi:F-type H+-transporting ATPase subunit epsilon
LIFAGCYANIAEPESSQERQEGNEMPIKLEIVTGEGEIFSDDVDSVVAPGVDGEMGILPKHAALMTVLQPGELRVKRGGQEVLMAVSGGFLEVLPHKITILADTAERAEDIDEARAEKSRQRAQEYLAAAARGEPFDVARAQAAMRRATVRLKVAQKKKRRGM